MGQYAPTFMTNKGGYDEDSDVLYVPENRIKPYIVGVARAGQLLTCNRGVWHGNLPTTYAFQWQRDGVNIAGATSQTFQTADPTDTTKTLTCIVTASNSQGAGTPATTPGVAIGAPVV